jgi:hypothetical protein
MEPDTFEIDGEIVHAYGCLCGRCRGMALALMAKTEDGKYFFTDEELLEISKAL